jgi:hypothetical protein
MHLRGYVLAARAVSDRGIRLIGAISRAALIFGDTGGVYPVIDSLMSPAGCDKKLREIDPAARTPPCER